MKTINGCPQFDEILDPMITVENIPAFRHANKMLLEWYKSRKCLNCKKMSYRGTRVSEDHMFNIFECNYLQTEVVESFSCVAFEEKK